MKITIKCKPKELADAVLAIQHQPKEVNIVQNGNAPIDIAKVKKDIQRLLQ